MGPQYGYLDRLLEVEALVEVAARGVVARAVETAPGGVAAREVEGVPAGAVEPMALALEQSRLRGEEQGSSPCPPNSLRRLRSAYEQRVAYAQGSIITCMHRRAHAATQLRVCTRTATGRLRWITRRR